MELRLKGFFFTLTRKEKTRLTKFLTQAINNEETKPIKFQNSHFSIFHYAIGTKIETYTHDEVLSFYNPYFLSISEDARIIKDLLKQLKG